MIESNKTRISISTGRDRHLFYFAGKKVILDLIEQATVAYDQREESQNKLFALKERDKVNVAMYGHEMRELQRELDHDFKLQEFLGKNNKVTRG